MKKLDKLSNKEILLSLAASLIVSITLFFFGPLEIIMASSSEFWFQASDIFILCLTCTLFCAVVLVCFLLVLKKINNFLFALGCSFITGIGLATYIQGNFTFVDYGIMDGSSIDWSGYTGWSYVNSLMWVVIVTAVMMLWKKFHNILKNVAFGIIAVELITLMTLVITQQSSEESMEYYFSSEGQMEFSEKGENILVILADEFDSYDFLGVLEEETDFKEHFDGFTYYPDTCGTSVYSQESAITLLTGEQLEVGLSFADNIKKAYENTILYNELEKNNYDISLYLCHPNMVSPGVADLVENTVYEKVQLNNLGETFMTLYKMVGFRYSPHMTKKYFWYSFADFEALKQNTSFQWSNTEFYEYLITEGINVNRNDNTYQFYWIPGPHSPAVMDRYCKPLEKIVAQDAIEYTDARFEQTIGVVRIFVEIIKQLKEQGVYDNTTIIFTADHGGKTRENPLFLVKPQFSKGDMKISTVPISVVEDYMPTLLYFVTGEKNSERTIYDIEESEKRERPFYRYDFSEDTKDRTYDDLIISYYESGTFLNSQILGKKLSPATLTQYCEKGLSGSEEGGVWSEGYETEFLFNIKEEYENVLLEFSYNIFDASQNIEIYANEKQIANYKAENNESKTILIPKDYIHNGELKLLFKFPDAKSPLETGKGTDERILAIFFKALMLSSVDDTWNGIGKLGFNEYELGTSLFFYAGNENGAPHCYSGFSSLEKSYTWTNGYEAELRFCVEEVKDDLNLTMDIEQIIGEKQCINVLVNGNEVKTMTITSGEIMSIYIPKSIIDDSGNVSIILQLPDAVSPKELGMSEDTRLLALAMKSITISSTNEGEN